jgi:Tol biopolymer transport system component
MHTILIWLRESRSVRFAMAPFVALTLQACGGGGDGTGGGDPGTSAPVTPSAVVFVDNSTAQNRLWAAVDDGSALQQLDDPAAMSVSSFEVSSGRDRVAFVQRSPASVPGLYVVGIGGGARTEVSGNVSAATTISQYEWSPDGSKLAFVSDQETAETLTPRNEVFVVDADGTNRVKASQGIADLVHNPQWSFDGRYVAIEVAEPVTAVGGGGQPLDGGGFEIAAYDTQTDTSVTSINNNVVGNAAHREFQAVAWSPDNQRIAYLLDRDANDKYELYISTIDGAMTVKPYASLVGSVSSFAWNPVDGSRIGYLADQDIVGVSELYTSAPDGTQNQKQHVDRTFDNLDVQRFAFSPDGKHIAFALDTALPGVTDLYVNTKPDDGDVNTPLQSVAIFQFPSTSLGRFDWWMDSSALVYAAGPVHGVQPSLWTVGRDGMNNHRVGFPNPAPLNGPLTSTGPIQTHSYLLSPFAPLVAYMADIDGDNFEELYVNSLAGGAEAHVNPRDPADPSITETIFWTAWSPVSTRLVYVSQKSGGERTLYASNAAGAAPIKLSAALAVRTLPPLAPVY